MIKGSIEWFKEKANSIDNIRFMNRIEPLRLEFIYDKRGKL